MNTALSVRFSPASTIALLALLAGVTNTPLRAALPMQPEQIVITHFSGTINYYAASPTATPNLAPNGYVVALYDTTTGNIGPLIPPTVSPPNLWDSTDVPPFSVFHNQSGQAWNAQRLGEVFGVTVDDAASPNIYVTATECYNIVGSSTPLPKGTGGPGGIYRLDGITGASSSGSLPNSANGPGLGNVCFRRAASSVGYLYVSNLEDGKIYRVNASTLLPVGTPYDHGVSGRGTLSLSTIPDDGTPGLTQFGRRIWGVKTFQDRLYYAVWWEDSRNVSLTESNEIWSVALNANGDFIPGSAQRNIILPNFMNFQWSQPVASIDFSSTGKMFLAERYWQYLAMIMNPTFGAHHCRVHRYWLSGSTWVTDPNITHQVGGDPTVFFGINMPGANSAGGVAVNCDESVWATGDMYAGSYSTPPNNPFGVNDLGWCYGALRIPSGGNSMFAGFGFGCFAVDFDMDTNSIAKFGVGAIATVRDCCVPPPTGLAAWWPLDELAGAGNYADLSGNGNTALIQSGGPLGSFQSPSPTLGKVAGASSFLDSLTRGRAPNAPSLNFGVANSFTIDCWVRPAPTGPPSWQTIVDKLDLNTARGYTFGISNGNLALIVGDGSIYNHIGPAVSPNIWNFAAVIVNRSANTVRFFLNGNVGLTQTLTPTGSFSNGVALLIGAPYTPNIISEISLDEIELFNRALGTNELTDLWLADNLGKCKSGLPPCSNSVVTIICPTNMTVACAPRVFYPPPRAFTSCGTITNVVCSPPSGTNFPVGPTIVTCTAYDSLGNSNSCTFTITVTPDTTPPTINCYCVKYTVKESLTVLGCQGIVPDLCSYLSFACVTDDCCVGSCVQNPPPGTPVGPGTNAITVTFYDCAGNSNSCVLNMVVNPPPEGCLPPCTTPPCCEIKCSTNIVVKTCGTSAIVNFPPPTLTNCPAGATFICNPPSGSSFPLGTNVVTCMVIDSIGTPIAACHFTVIVLPQTPSWSVTCPNPAISINVTGCPPVMPNLSNYITITTNCPSTCPITVQQSITPGTPLTAGTHVAIVNICQCGTNCFVCDVTVKAWPTSGNPTIICPPNQVILTCSTNAVATYKIIASGYTGTIVCSPPPGTLLPLGTHFITCTATNACGGIATCTFTVTVKRPNTKWPCDWQVGIGLPFEPIGGASTALRAVGPGSPVVCIFPNPANPNSGALLHLGQAQTVTFTTELDFTAPVGAGMDLVLPPGPNHSNGIPLLSFRSKGFQGYAVKANKRFPDLSSGLFRTIAVNTNGQLLDSFTFDSSEALTNDTLRIGFQPGVTNCHVTVELDCLTGTMAVEFTGPVVPSALRKGWDGCIYGPDRPIKKPTAKVYFVPPPTPGEPPITDLYLYASGLAEVGVQEPTLTAQGRKWGDGHVTLMKAYDDGESMEFAVMGNNGEPVHVDLGHADTFDLRLTKLETNSLPGEQLLTRTLGTIGGLPEQPPFLDALLLSQSGTQVECSADFSHLGSPTVRIQVFHNHVLVAGRTGVPAGLGQPLLTLPTWPEHLGNLGGTIPGRRGTFPPGMIMFPSSGAGLPPLSVTGDEFRILAEPPPGTPHPAFYSGFEFIATEDGNWGVSELTRTTICVPAPLAIARGSDGVTVTWSGEPFRLQGAEAITGPWFDLGADSPVSVPANSAARYFRLVCD